jgi:biopolymer transport protein TolQ
MLQLFLNASILIKCVILLLVGLSIASWAFILYKYLHLKNASRLTREVLEDLQKSHSSTDFNKLISVELSYDSPLISTMKLMVAKEPHKSKEEIHRHLKLAQSQELENLESYMVFLATVGSTAPFIGLFGTVWGIMDAFRGIGEAGSASLAVVAPGIAEALITTAVGLAAAIPAVMAYNFFVNWIRKVATEVEDCMDAFQSIISSRVK